MFKFIIFIFFLCDLSFSSVASYATAIKKVKPSVVGIENLSKDDSKHFLIKSILDDFKNTQEVKVHGSGVLVTSSGYVVTNFHVVSGFRNLKVTLANKEYLAKVVAVDRDIDLALLKIMNSNGQFKPIEFGDSDKLNVGDVVLAFGNPFNIGETVTSGIISSSSPRKNISKDLGQIIQTDVATNPGNSGGALTDSDGKLIGINVSKYAKNNAAGISFAVPANVVKLFMERTMKGETVKKYWTGMSALAIDDKLRKKFSLPVVEGILVYDVYKNGPAAQAGLKKGDIIVGINDKRISSIIQFSYKINMINEKQLFYIHYIRNNKRYKVPMRVGLPPENPKRNLLSISDGSLAGLIIGNSSPAVAYELGFNYTKKGVVVFGVQAGSIMDKKGIKEGDFIAKVNNKKIVNINDIISVLDKQSANIDNITILRRGKVYSLKL